MDDRLFFFLRLCSGEQRVTKSEREQLTEHCSRTLQGIVLQPQERNERTHAHALRATRIFKQPKHVCTRAHALLRVRCVRCVRMSCLQAHSERTRRTSERMDAFARARLPLYLFF